MLFISNVYNMPNYFPQKSKIYSQMSRVEFIHVPPKRYFLCLLVEGMILSMFFFTCPVLKRLLLKSRELLYVIQKGVRNNNNQHFLGWENSSLP